MNSFLSGVFFSILFVLWIVLSWIVVHGLALLGVFVAVAYPFWWLLASGYTVCFLCKAKPNGSYCPFCRRQISKAESTSPGGLISAFLNASLILFLSIVSVAVVYAETLILREFGFPPNSQTASFIIPAKGQYRIGEIFPMKIEVENLQNSINTVQADVGFDMARVEVVHISTADSFASIFLQEEINNEGGWARLTGGLPNPGFFDRHGVFGTIYFRGKTAGLVEIGFLPSSMILANDGAGTNILQDPPKVSYLILPERIGPEEAEGQQALVSSLQVLGADSDQSSQLKLYDEGSVLGTASAELSEVSESPGVRHFMLNASEAIDRFILDFWKAILHFFIDF